MISAAVLALAACGDRPPVVTAVNTLCVSTSRYHASEEQKRAFLENEALWGPLVRWLAGFNKVRDAECLRPSPFP